MMIELFAMKIKVTETSDNFFLPFCHLSYQLVHKPKKGNNKEAGHF